ncbi:MAG: hypothetical protein RLZZ502_814 [Pseudomonadota bacterium]|jgi:uncharacterized protein YggU (UPF0235/DUF167 family)
MSAKKPKADKASSTQAPSSVASNNPKDGTRVIAVRVKPRAPLSHLEQEADGNWVAKLRASPVDGQANSELLALVAKHFACSRTQVQIISGATARRKLLRLG